MWIIRHRVIFFILGILFIGVSLGLVFAKGFTYGVEFTGGTAITVAVDPVVDTNIVAASVNVASPESRTQRLGDNLFVIHTTSSDTTLPTRIVTQIATDTSSSVSLQQVSAIGPSVGSELRSKATWALIIVALGIIFFIAYAFRRVSKPVSSWAYGLIAVVVLIHDVSIPAGFFAITNRTIDPLFIVGLLTVLGISINDTIVVFDRIREHLDINEKLGKKEAFAEVVGESIRATMTRSLMTSLTVLLALLALVLWGPASTHNLSLVMLLGMFFGTYSSIFLASPLLVVWNNWQEKKKAKAE